MRYIFKKLKNHFDENFKNIIIIKTMKNFLVSVETDVHMLSDYCNGYSYIFGIGNTLKDAIYHMLKNKYFALDKELFFPYIREYNLFEKKYNEK
jgi:hypothetical protein